MTVKTIKKIMILAKKSQKLRSKAHQRNKLRINCQLLKKLICKRNLISAKIPISLEKAILLATKLWRRRLLFEKASKITKRFKMKEEAKRSIKKNYPRLNP